MGLREKIEVARIKREQKQLKKLKESRVREEASAIRRGLRAEHEEKIREARSKHRPSSPTGGFKKALGDFIDARAAPPKPAPRRRAPKRAAPAKVVVKIEGAAVKPKKRRSRPRKKEKEFDPWDTSGFF